MRAVQCENLHRTFENYLVAVETPGITGAMQNEDIYEHVFFIVIVIEGASSRVT